LKRNLFFSVLLAALVTVAAAPLFAADTLVVDKAHSEANFSVRHLVARVSGHFSDFDAKVMFDKANPASSSVQFTVKTTSIWTGVDQRDTHLRSQDFFWVEKYPELSFKSPSIKKTGDSSYDVTGELSLRGVTKTITLPVTFLGEVKDPMGNAKFGFATETTLDRKDYGINWNKALDQGGMLLSDEVKVQISLEMKKG